LKSFPQYGLVCPIAAIPDIPSITVKNYSIIVRKLHFHTAPESVDYLIALLAELPFNAFEEVDDGVVTALPELSWNEDVRQYIESLKDQVPFTYTVETEKVRNWNAVWESKFREIIIGDFCSIRAPFHQPSASCRHDIIIEPRMAFGTGHHETTRLMIRSMETHTLTGTKVMDFGSGSGILAILAAKMGADEVWAVENDEQAFVNLKENILINEGDQIIAHCSDNLSDFKSEGFDFVLANITRNVLSDHAPELARILKKNGLLIISGFLGKDREILVNTFLAEGLKAISHLDENDWIAQTFQKN